MPKLPYPSASLRKFIQTHPLLWALSITVFTGGLAALWYGVQFLLLLFKKRALSTASTDPNSSSTPKIIKNLLHSKQEILAPTLHSVCKIDESEAILAAQKLLSQGCSLAERDLQKFDDFANTPLLAAVAYEKFNLAHLFIQHIIQNNQQTVFDLQDQQKNSQNTALTLAVMQGHENIALDIIRGGANIHLTAAEGFTALHYACMLRLKSVIIELLNRGADPQSPNDLGATPQDYYLYDFPLNPGHFFRLSQSNGRVLIANKQPILEITSDGNVLTDVRHIGHHRGFDSLFNGDRPQKETVLIELLGISHNHEQSTAFSKRANDCYRTAINRTLDYISQTPTSIYCYPQTLTELFNSKYAQHLFSLERSHLEYSEQELNDQAVLHAKEETCNELLGLF